MTGRRAPFLGSLRIEDSSALVTVAGEIDLATVERFRALVDAAVAVEPSKVTLDMAAVEYVGLCAVPVLQSAAERLGRGGSRFVVRNVPRVALRLFGSSGLSETLEVEPAGSDAAVVRGLVATTRIRSDRQVLDAGLKLVVRMAQAVVTGADGVSITLPRHGQLGTVAASNDVVLEMDHDQYDTGQGPCMDAATQGRRFHIDALAEETRWPDFVPRARARGIESILSIPLVTADRAIGALNLYSRTSGAFAAHEMERADQFAAEASIVVSTADPGARKQTFDSELFDALLSRHVIAMAQGILLERNGGSPGAAYTVLRDTSRRTGRPLREICDEMVTSITSGPVDPVEGGGHARRAD